MISSSQKASNKPPNLRIQHDSLYCQSLAGFVFYVTWILDRKLVASVWWFFKGVIAEEVYFKNWKIVGNGLRQTVLRVPYGL